MTDWQPIETAPRDGTEIIVWPESGHGAFIAKWDPQGTSWVSEEGKLGTDRWHHIEQTGFWASGDGWFQPDELTHWQPLPKPPSEER